MLSPKPSDSLTNNNQERNTSAQVRHQHSVVDHYACLVDDVERKHVSLMTEPGIFGFETVITLRNTSVLFMGDSVNIQFSQHFEKLAGATNRTVLKYSWSTREGIHVSRVRGGGVVAGWRLLGLLSRQGLTQALPNKPGGGWRLMDVSQLLDNSTVLPGGERLGKMDIVIFTIPFGWVDLDRISESTLQEATELANEIFGAQTVVWTSIPFDNNVQTEIDHENVNSKNTMIQNFCRTWRPRERKSDPQKILFWDFAGLVSAFLHWNARNIGVEGNPNFATHQQCCRMPKVQLNRSQALFCSERVPRYDRHCAANSFSKDGKHYCMDYIGSRIGAGLACLLVCAHNDDWSDLRECENRCNDQYMSLKPLQLSQTDTYQVV